MAEEIVEPTGPAVAEALCASGESAGVEPLAAEPTAAEPLAAGPLAVESLAAEPSAAASFPEQPAMPRFITLEGIDGCGKSTQAKLLAEDLERAGYDVLLLREPGGVTISEKIRELLLDPAHAAMSDTCELLLYEAARAQLVHEVVAPALAQGRIVVCDRFYDSTTAYQGYANGMDLGAVQRANTLAVGACHPDLTLVFDIDPAKAAARAAARDRAQDRMEAKGFAYQERVAAGFRAIAAAESERVRLVDASRGIDAIHADVRALVLGQQLDTEGVLGRDLDVEGAGCGDFSPEDAENVRMAPEDAPSVRISPENVPHGGKSPEDALCCAGGHVPGGSAGKT